MQNRFARVIYARSARMLHWIPSGRCGMGVVRGARRMVDGGAEVVGSFVRIALWMFVLGLVIGLVLGAAVVGAR